jgi:hypothetical protein
LEIAMAAIVSGKYQLKSLHEEIDFVDRKIAHMRNIEKFGAETDRDAAVRKLTVKRESLIKTAKAMAAEGIEFKSTELPRSLRPKGEELAEEPKAEPVEAPAPAARAAQPQMGTSYAGTALDWQASIAEYIEKRKKGRTADTSASNWPTANDLAVGEQ